ncbi:MAG: substrate-binding domain-containing protein [Alphaproteobacteria bacterium]
MANDGEELRILSAGAVKTGAAARAEDFGHKRGLKVEITFATAPKLRQLIESGQGGADVIIAPVAAMAAFENKGQIVAGSAHEIGSVKAAVVVWDGAPMPDISSAEAFKAAVLAADSLVYNQASSGLYIEKLMVRLGIAAELAAKTRRTPTGGAVMELLAANRNAGEIGFGQITEIRVYDGKGSKLVGPLPADIGNITTYAAGVAAVSGRQDLAAELVGDLTSDEAREVFFKTGVE